MATLTHPTVGPLVVGIEPVHAEHRVLDETDAAHALDRAAGYAQAPRRMAVANNLRRERGQLVPVGGPATAARLPQDTAAWPLSDTPPGCWFHTGQAATLAAFPVPASAPELAGVLRGRLYSVVVFHDRPEVRRVLAGLMGTTAAAAGVLADGLTSAGLWPIGAGVTGLPEAGAITVALQHQRFRVSVTDLVPRAASTAFGHAVAQLVASTAVDAAARARELGWLIAQVQASWPKATAR